MSFNVTDRSKLLETYSNWAGSTQFDTVAGQKAGGPVTDLSKAVSGFARVFNRGAADSARRAALEGFKSALTQTVGAGIADEVWRGIGGADARGLTAEMVKSGLDLTNRLVSDLKAKLLPGKDVGVLFDLSAGEIPRWVNVGKVTPETIRNRGKVAVMLAKSDAFLCMSPVSKKEADTLADAMFRMADDLSALAAKGDARQIGERIKALKQRATELKALGPSLAEGGVILEGLAKHWQASLERACRNLLDGAKGDEVSDEVRNSLKKALDGLREKYADGKMLSKVKGAKKKLCGKIERELTSTVKKALGRKLPGKVSALLGKAFENAHLETLNKAKWETIEKSFDGFVGGKKVELKSTITCGLKINEEAFKQKYDRGVQSYNCHSTWTANAVNLATSELQVGGETVFRGVRHGVHSAKCDTKAERLEANHQRAEQTVNAAFVEYLKRHPGLKGSTQVIDLDMVSISLQTPSVSVGGEKDKVFAQKEAWDWINNTKGVVQVPVNGHVYKVKPKVTQLFYGVNGLAVAMRGEVSTGWGNVSGLNRAGLEALLGRAEHFAEYDSPDQNTERAIRTLCAQIRDMASHKSERSQGNEPYKMPARLAVLAYLTEGIPVWNCKSGKDRTGMLDVEAKFLSTLIARGEPIPKPDEKLSQEQTQLLRTILLESGNLEMQRYNTGAEGYKLDGVKSLYKRLHADKVEKAAIKGGSGYIGH